MKNLNIIDVGGFTILWHPKPGPITTCRMICNTGSVRETPTEYGAAHYLEHMFFKGTEKKDYKQLDKELSALGDHNAYTSYDRTGYYINCLNEDFPKAFNLLLELIFESRFDEKEFVKENTVIQEEIQMYLDDPGGYFSDTVFESIWGIPGHRIIGTKDSVGNMTVDIIKGFKSKWYDKQNMVFVVCGGVEPKEWGAIYDLGRYADTIPDGVAPFQWINRAPDFTDLEFDHASTQAILSLTMMGINAEESKKRNYVDDLFLNALGQSSHSVMFERIRQELGLCYTISAYDHGYGQNDTISIHTMIDAKNIDLVRDEILKTYAKVQQQGFTEEVLEISKKSILYSVCRAMETATRLAASMFDSYFIDGVFDPDDFRAKLVTLTNKDMIKFANEMASGGWKLAVMNR